MKKILSIIIGILMLAALCSCGGTVKVTLEEMERTPAAADAAKWSVFVYMCGGSKSAEVVNELCGREYPSNINIVLQTGGGSEWSTDGIDGEFIQRFVMQKDSIFLKDQKQAASMGNYETLRDFLVWGIDAFPADRYMLVLVGDGTGTEVLSDKNFSNDTLTVEELSYAVSLAGRNFDIIGFDGAYSASFENAAALSPYASYMVASEEKCIGWDYGRLADCLITYPYALPNEIGQIICDNYYEKCVDSGYEEMASMSLTDLSHISLLAQAFDGMAGMMAETVDGLDSYGALARNVLGAQRCVGSGDMVDLASLAAAIAPNVGETAQGVIDAIGQSVIYNVRGSLRPGSNGLSVYYPRSIDENKLNNYMKSTISDNYKLFIKCISPGVNVVDEYVSSDYRESWAWCDYVGREFECSSYMSDDSRYSLSISGDMSIVKDVRLNKYWYYPDTNAYCSLGTDNNLDCDWAGQTYMDNVTPVAPKLNGHLMQADMADEIRDVGKIYTTPVLINNEMGEILSFYSWQTGKFSIIGVWQDGVPVEVGFKDRVATVHSVMDNEETLLTGKVFRPFTGLKVKNAAIPNGSYILEYELEDVYSKIRRAERAHMDKNRNETMIYQ